MATVSRHEVLTMRFALAVALSGALAVALSPRIAEACGGCFIPPVQDAEHGTVVTAHRMALAISTDQTTLWDQVQYSGSPAEFAWVLPVKPGARIEVATDAWFDVLEAATQAVVSPPLLSCASGGGFLGGCSIAPVATPIATSFGCGESAASGDGAGDTPSPVTVVNHGSVGPYEAEVLHSTDPDALPTWLKEHGYDLPADVSPLIEAYASEGFDFAALRLLPAAGVNQMRPIRIVQPGAIPTLPLRMVAAGTGAQTAITLFVIGEGRYTTQNFPEVEVPSEALVWDFESASSNYATLRDGVLSAHGGSVFAVPYAQRGPIFGPIQNTATNVPMTYETTNKWIHSTVADAFVSQAFVNGETAGTDCADRFDNLETDARRVVLPCNADGVCTTIDEATQIDGRSLECEPPLGSNIPLDDLAQALNGMHPRDVWITRLEANLSRAALATDLVLTPSPNQEPKNGGLAPREATNLPAQCELQKDKTDDAQSFIPPLFGGKETGGPKTSAPKRSALADSRLLIGIVMTIVAALLALRRHARVSPSRRAEVRA